ncbi:MAG TPA: hypothetical protein VFK39_11825 [Gemmatimonadaceae bacterium]|nr:hypothetical protein [Gemmatimonadaceae bacterium]
MRRSFCWLAVVAFAACAHNPEPRADSGSALSEGSDSAGSATSQLAEVTGRVMVGGTDRFVMVTLQRSDGRALRLTGKLLDELRRLGTAEVTARGVVDSSGTVSLDVREYEVLAIDGQRPHVGVLLARGPGGDELWLAGGDTLRLVPTLDALRESVGAKIWVTGVSDPAARELRIGSYGVIAPAR